jgi:hypothetical protein
MSAVRPPSEMADVRSTTCAHEHFFSSIAAWDVESYDVVGDAVALSALTIPLGLAALRRAAKPIRFTGPAGPALSCVVIRRARRNPYTSGAAIRFYALVAVWCGQPRSWRVGAVDLACAVRPLHDPRHR